MGRGKVSFWMKCIIKEDSFMPFLKQSEYYFILAPSKCWPSDYSIAEKAFLTRLKFEFK